MKEFMERLSKEEMKKVVGGKMRGDKCSGSCDFVWTDTNGNKHNIQLQGNVHGLMRFKPCVTVATAFKYLLKGVLSKHIQKGEFPFSQFLFWDTPVEKMDLEKHKNYIIERILSSGAITGLLLSVTTLFSK